jgi:TolA-binding protein
MAAQAVAAAIGQVAGMAGKFAEAKNTRLQGTLADKQGFQNTQQQLLTLKQQREAQRQTQTQEQAKNRRTLIIALVAGAVLIAILVVIYLLKSNK